MTAEEQAIATFEDAASRGFPNGNQVALQSAIYLARALVNVEPVATVDAEPVAPVDAEPVAPVDAEPVAPVESEGA